MLDRDEDGLLVVSTRVRNPASLHSPTQLILLSPKSRITHLLVQTLHRAHSHAGISALMEILCSTYHTPGLRNTLKGISKSCPNCQRAYAKPLTHLMGLLPSTRTTPAPVFHHTGVDFAGPLYIKLSPTHQANHPESVCMLICVLSKQSHPPGFRYTKDLSTKEFLATFVFAGTAHMLFWSDNGTFFVGARSKIRELQSFMESPKIKSAMTHFASSLDIQWHHSPPRAPHFGGLWEAGVWSGKTWPPIT